MIKILVIETTSDSRDLLEEIARTLLENKLIACAQIEPIHSMYWWNDGITEDNEFRLTVKLLEENKQPVILNITSNHNYEVPELLISVKETYIQYYSWVEKNSK
ncbi:MAG: divalent-cation tolerance protein CutA [Candidatus Heimdallarchaeota archaeon]|nr:divalent-cation tolerance protein CutA [Candidatus Heimdallarchaeota archaeon]